MRPVSILTALLVSAALYAIVLDRERLLDWARAIAPAQAEAPAAAEQAEAEAVPDVPEDGAVAVMAQHSVAEEIDDAVILRGETQALREVEVRAESSGRVISAPLPKGSEVEAGQILCELDPGTTEAGLAEARARLAEAEAQRPLVEARLPEARALLAQAQAQ
ncbi:MAG TPA: efflux RND transporter periplasmic adaptor subunit, partial [Citreicella sp.]|nr:efflux RND transporter periplasmic adaptor subunit [Citreicella sp.]